uniref:Uncharacterized protein n=1 Tax=Rhizophora mucronata TaxID=61149 RepID=A0A2P2NWH1_RHIMU
MPNAGLLDSFMAYASHFLLIRLPWPTARQPCAAFFFFLLILLHAYEILVLKVERIRRANHMPMLVLKLQ